MGIDVAKCFGHPAIDYLSNHDSASDHREVGCQRTVSFEPTKRSKIVGDERHKDVSAEIVNIVCRESNAATVGRVLSDVDKKPHEPVYKVLPRTWFFIQASFQ